MMTLEDHLTRIEQECNWELQTLQNALAELVDLEKRELINDAIDQLDRYGEVELKEPNTASIDSTRQQMAVVRQNLLRLDELRALIQNDTDFARVLQEQFQALSSMLE